MNRDGDQDASRRHAWFASRAPLWLCQIYFRVSPSFREWWAPLPPVKGWWRCGR